jgi:hypothetical protein
MKRIANLINSNKYKASWYIFVYLFVFSLSVNASSNASDSYFVVDHYKLLFGRNKPVCQIVEKKVNYNLNKFGRAGGEIDKGLMSSIEWKKTKYTYSKSVMEKNKFGPRFFNAEYANVDINNDGHKEKVLRYYAYPNNNITQDLLVYEDDENRLPNVIEYQIIYGGVKKDYKQKAFIIDKNDYREQIKITATGSQSWHRDIDVEKVYKENPSYKQYNLGNGLGAVWINVFSYSDVTYVILGSIYTSNSRANIRSSWILVGKLDGEKVVTGKSKEGKNFTENKLDHQCYLLGLDSNLPNEGLKINKEK